MADFGLGAAYGAQNLQGLLRQRLADQIAAQERDRKAMEADRNFGLQQQQFQSNEELKRAQLEATAQARHEAALTHQSTEADRRFGIAQHLGESLPPDQFIPQQDPAVGMMQAGGTGSLLNPTPATQPMGQDFTGPMPNSETPQQAQVGRPAGFIKTASAAQQEKATSGQERQARDQAVAENRDTLAGIRQQLADTAQQRADAGKPSPTPHFTAQDRFDPETGKPQSGLLNTLTGEWKPTPGLGSVHAPPGAAQLATKAEAVKKAQSTLDRLDQDINLADQKKLIGPAAGRVSDVENYIGNADPAFSTLATRMTAAKLLVDAGIGGMRAAASPQLLARWDKVMSAPMNAANLHASVQVLREMLGGESKTPPLSAAELIKKYGGR